MDPIKFKENNSQTNKLITFASFSNIKVFGIEGIKLFGIILFTFGLMNLIFLAINIFNFVGRIENNLTSSVVSFALGSISIFLALFKCYRYTLNKGLKIIYNHTIPFFRKLCERIIDYVDTIVTDTINIKSIHIDKAFSIGDMLYSMYGNTVPSFAQKGISILVSRIPFNNFLFEIKDSIRERNKEKASTALFNEVDNYISKMFEGEGLKILYLVFIVNLIGQILILYII